MVAVGRGKAALVLTITSIFEDKIKKRNMNHNVTGSHFTVMRG